MISIHSQINALSRSRWTSNHLHVLRSPPSSGVSTVVVCHKKDIRANTSTGIQHVEVDYLEAEASATEPEPPKPFMSAVQTHETENRTYMVRSNAYTISSPLSISHHKYCVVPVGSFGCNNSDMGIGGEARCFLKQPP